MSFHTLFMEMDEGMKKILRIFSVLYVAIPGILVWYAWTDQMTFREGQDLKGKLLMTAIAVFMAVVANWVAWDSYFRWKKVWGKK